MAKKKVNVRKDYSYEHKKSPPQYGRAAIARKNLYVILRGPGLDPNEFPAENEELKSYALKHGLKVKFVQAKDAEAIVTAIKEANVSAAGIVLNMGEIEDESGKINAAIRKILISTIEVREEGAYLESLKELFNQG
jgi:hypothetical protein